MSEVYAAPGVYVEEHNALALSIQGGATAVPVFVGHFSLKNASFWDDPFEQGCVRVESWLEFATRFDLSDSATVAISEDPTAPFEVTAHLGSYSLRLYFENGGGPCYVLPLPKKHTDAELAKIPAAIERYPDITLLCFCERYTTKEEEQPIYNELSKLLGASPTSGGNLGMFLLADARCTDRTNKTFETPTISEPTQAAMYFPVLKTTYPYAPPDDARTFVKDVHSIQPRDGNGNLDKEFSAAIIAAFGGANPPLEWLRDFSTSSDARQTYVRKLYADIRRAVDKATKDTPVILRASVAMAGVYAKVDRERGVWKAPANVALAGVADLVDVETTKEGKTSVNPIRIDQAVNEALVDAKINAIRAFRGQGILAWGARTMSDPHLTDWRYIPVRRLFNTVERDARAALRTVVFEPNSAPTWEAVRGALDHYLHALWRQGGLVGDTAEQAYFVHVGLGVTMQQADIDAGKMIVKVGLAAVRPAEFIVLQLTQDRIGMAVELKINGVPDATLESARIGQTATSNIQAQALNNLTLQSGWELVTTDSIPVLENLPKGMECSVTRYVLRAKPPMSDELKPILTCLNNNQVDSETVKQATKANYSNEGLVTLRKMPLLSIRGHGSAIKVWWCNPDLGTVGFDNESTLGEIKLGGAVTFEAVAPQPNQLTLYAMEFTSSHLIPNPRNHNGFGAFVDDHVNGLAVQVSGLPEDRMIMLTFDSFDEYSASLPTIGSELALPSRWPVDKQPTTVTLTGTPTAGVTVSCAVFKMSLEKAVAERYATTPLEIKAKTASYTAEKVTGQSNGLVLSDKSPLPHSMARGSNFYRLWFVNPPAGPFGLKAGSKIGDLLVTSADLTFSAVSPAPNTVMIYRVDIQTDQKVKPGKKIGESSIPSPKPNDVTVTVTSNGLSPAMFTIQGLSASQDPPAATLKE